MAKLVGTQPFYAVTVDALQHDCGDELGFLLGNGETAIGGKRARAHQPFAGQVAFGVLDG